MINLEWYRTFKAIYQNGTLTKAAKELIVSQPNVSIQLASLETYIGHPLFIRLPRKMEPTEYGKRLYTQIVESIDNLERIESEFKKTVLSQIPTISFGTPSELFLSYFAANISQLKCNVDIRYGMANDFIEQLINGELDIAIITKKSVHPLLTYEPLFIETFAIICHPKLDTTEFDELIQKGDIAGTERWLKEMTWYAYSNNLALIRRFWRENFKKRPVLRLHGVIPDNNAILKGIANSETLAVTSDIIGAKAITEGSVKVLWQGITKTVNTIYLAYNKNKIQAQQINEIREFIQKSISHTTTNS